MVVLFAMHIEWYYFSGILLIEETVRIYCYSFRIFLFIVDSFVAPNRSRLYCIYGIRLYSIGITCELQGVRRSDAFSPIYDHIAFFFTLRSFRLCSGSGFMKMMMMFGAIIFDTMSFGDEDLPARKERRTLFKLIQQQEMREEGNGAAVLCVLCEICCVCDPGKGSLLFSV